MTAPTGSSARREPVARDQHVARVLAPGHGSDDQPRLRRGRQVLVRVHRDVDTAAEHRVAQRRDEHPGAADLGQRGGRPVAGGHDLDRLGLDPQPGQRRDHRRRLAPGQRAGPRTDPQHPLSHD
jgi:hypothetical protein